MPGTGILILNFPSVFVSVLYAVPETVIVTLLMGSLSLFVMIPAIFVCDVGASTMMRLLL